MTDHAQHPPSGVPTQPENAPTPRALGLLDGANLERSWWRCDNGCTGSAPLDAEQFSHYCKKTPRLGWGRNAKHRWLPMRWVWPEEAPDAA